MEAHISTQQSALGHYGPQAQGVPITAQPLLWKRGMITYEKHVHIALQLATM